MSTEEGTVLTISLLEHLPATKGGCVWCRTVPWSRVMAVLMMMTMTMMMMMIDDDDGANQRSDLRAERD